MIINRFDQGAVTVLRFEGDIDETGMNEVRVALMECLEDGCHNVVVNLSEVNFVSYMGVGVLVERLRQLRTAGGDMKLVGVNLYTERLFRMVGVTKIFEQHDSELHAVQSYREAA